MPMTWLSAFRILVQRGEADYCIYIWDYTRFFPSNDADHLSSAGCFYAVLLEYRKFEGVEHDLQLHLASECPLY
jgi:hypothetical protein